MSNSKHPDMYNGVVLGALMILIGLAWFALPLLFAGKLLLYPGILVLLGIITMIRHSISSGK
ncbi:MAG TPA: hypothetical protein VK151_18525 [Fluviicola sp.]|nr:hypothetical protein [Fluviicola sp.]